MKTQNPYYLEIWMYPMEIQLKCSCHERLLQAFCGENAMYSMKEVICMYTITKKERNPQVGPG